MHINSTHRGFKIFKIDCRFGGVGSSLSDLHHLLLEILDSMCFVFSQADNFPDIPSQTVTEEKYTDEHGNMVVKKVRDHSKMSTTSQYRKN